MRGRLSRRLGFALVASLAVNLFLGGMLTSQWLLSGGEPPPKPPRAEGHFNRTAARAAISEPYRAAVDAVWAQNREGLRAKARAMAEARHAIREKLLAEPFDRGALDQAHAELTRRLVEARAAMEANIGELAAVLPLEERRRYFAASRARPPRPPHGPPPHGPPNGPPPPGDPFGPPQSRPPPPPPAD